jgi:two-component system, chemotaxis family, chemotaxis protein CheY
MKTLIVEDEFLARALLSTLLSEYGICHVAVNGKEALDAIKIAFDENKPYDLICLDIMMPVMNGQEALLELRKMEMERGLKGMDITKVIMITAIDDSKDIVNAFRQGQCEAYLNKPLNRNKLLSHLRDLGLIA